MISAEEIGYELDIEENICIEDLRKRCDDRIIVWISGSGAAPRRRSGTFMWRNGR